MREPSPRSRGPLLRLVHRGPRPRLGGALTGVERAAAMGYRDSPRYDEKEKGSKGSSPRVANGRGAMECSRRRGCDGGGDLLSTIRGSGRGETKVGAALDAVGSGRGVGAFYRATEGRGGAGM
jgi:hypothetical protein